MDAIILSNKLTSYSIAMCIRSSSSIKEFQNLNNKATKGHKLTNSGKPLFQRFKDNETKSSIFYKHPH